MSRINFELEEWQGTNLTTDNSTTWQDTNSSLRIELENQDINTTYIFMNNVILGGTNASYNGHQFRWRDGATTIANSQGRYEPMFSGVSDGYPFQMIRKYTSGNPTVDTRIQMRTIAAAVGRQASAARGNAYLIELAGMAENTDWFYSESTAEITAVSDSAWVDGEEITIGDGSSDYVVWTHGMTDSNVTNGNDIRHRIFDGTTGYMELRLEHEDTNDVWAVGTCMFFSAPAASTVIKSQWRSDNATSPFDLEFNTIFCLRLDVFEDHAGIHSTSITTLTSVDTDHTVQTLTHTANTLGADRWWMYHGTCIADQGNTSKRMDCFMLDSAGADFTLGPTRRSSCAASTDRMRMSTWGAVREPDGANVDIELVVQEESTGSLPRVVETVLFGFTPKLKALTGGVDRITGWEGTYPAASSTAGNGLEDNDSFGVVTPITGPTGNVTIASGNKRLFVFMFTAEDPSEIVVSAFTIGGITSTGKFEGHFATNGTADMHTYFYWWDEAAITSMTGLAIAWTDNQTWISDDAHHTWATFINVDQNDPVPSADHNSVGTNDIDKHTVATPGERFVDYSIVLFAGADGNTNAKRLSSHAIIFNSNIGTYNCAMAESNHPNSSVIYENTSSSTADALISSIRLQAVQGFKILFQGPNLGVDLFNGTLI